MDGSPESHTKWREIYIGGSPEAELKETKALAEMMMAAQQKAMAAGGARTVDRAFHKKAIAAFKGAELRFVADLPDDLQVGFAQPDARYPAMVRFSNASSQTQSDEDKDLRGLAVRIHESDGVDHDLLATNFPVPHARNARSSWSLPTLLRVGACPSWPVWCACVSCWGFLKPDECLAMSARPCVSATVSRWKAIGAGARLPGL